MPKAQPDQATSPPIPSTSPPQPNDPFAPFMNLLRGYGVPSPTIDGLQETPQQRRRRLLQDAKNRAVDHYWLVTGTVTPEMHASAKLTIDRELRNEPLEEWSPQEVIQLAEGVRDRVYNSFLRKQEKDARRIKDEAEQNRSAQRNEDRKHTERTKRKAAYLDEARRRVVNFLKAQTLSPFKRMEALEEILSLLDRTLTGDEPVSEAYAALEAILEARTAELNAQEAAKETKQQRECRELAMVIGVLIAVWIMHATSPELLQWLLNILSSATAEGPGSTPKPTTEPPQQSSEERTPRRPIRRVRRPPQSSSPISEHNSDDPFSS